MKTCVNIINNVVKYDYTKEWEPLDCDRTTHAYIINKRCSTLFLSNLNNKEFFGLQLDHYMTKVLKKYNKDIYNLIPLLCHSDCYDSDIAHNCNEIFKS